VCIYGGRGYLRDSVPSLSQLRKADHGGGSGSRSPPSITVSQNGDTLPGMHGPCYTMYVTLLFVLQLWCPSCSRR